MQAIEHDYPNTAMKEQVLEALAPAAIEAGHPQAAVEALEAYPATSVHPALLLAARSSVQSGTTKRPRGEGLPASLLQKSAV